jgi:hypothetical protein
MELIGPYLVACVLLVLAGGLKAVRPDDTARALAPLIPGRARPRFSFGRLRQLIRTAAGLEAALGVVALVWPRPIVAGLVAASYLAFAAFVAYARAKGGALASCGCFGTPDGNVAARGHRPRPRRGEPGRGGGCAGCRFDPDRADPSTPPWRALGRRECRGRVVDLSDLVRALLAAGCPTGRGPAREARLSR